METIKLADGRTVYLKDYITAKTKSLQEFGYQKLTEKEVQEQYEAIVAGKELSVIGHFMKDDIEVPEKKESKKPTTKKKKKK